MNEIIRDYSDIINLPHHESKTHPRMDRGKRAAQFAPFAALTGYESMIEEAGEANAQKDDTVIFSQEDIWLP